MMLKRLLILVAFTLALATPAQAAPAHSAARANEGTHAAVHRLEAR